MCVTDRFLKAKVTILQQELDLSHQDNVKHLDNLSKAVEQQKKTEGARCLASNTINSLNSQIRKIQQNEANIALKLKVKQNKTNVLSFLYLFLFPSQSQTTISFQCRKAK